MTGWHDFLNSIVAGVQTNLAQVLVNFFSSIFAGLFPGA